MLKTNKEKVVKGSVVGKIRPNVCRGWRVAQDGKPFLTPGIGGINYNVKLGDYAFGLAGDHIEPGVSLYHDNKDFSEYLNILSCIGNEAVVMSGEGKGKRRFVTGKHGGAEDVMICFEDETLDLLCPEDKVLIRAHGQGLKLVDYPEISAMNIDPELFEKLGIEENGDGTLTVPVAAVIPPYLMGSGIGSNLPFRGDYDIMTHDPAKVKELGLDKSPLRRHSNASGLRQYVWPRLPHGRGSHRCNNPFGLHACRPWPRSYSNNGLPEAPHQGQSRSRRKHNQRIEVLTLSIAKRPSRDGLFFGSVLFSCSAFS